MGKKNKILLRILVVFLIVFIVRTSFSFTLLKAIALNASKLPLQIISLTFLPYKSLVSSRHSLRDVSDLTKENQMLKLRLMQFKDIASENKRLRQLLSLKQESQFSVLAARVIGSDASNFKRTLLIDKGERDGIRKGDPVVGGEGMIGMVMETGVSSSQIILISDPDFSMAAKDSRSRATGIIAGSLEGGCVFKYLTSDEDILPGDEIVSRGGNSRFPLDIPIGTVVSLSKDATGLNMVATVKPKVRLRALEEVLVIVND